MHRRIFSAALTLLGAAHGLWAGLNPETGFYRFQHFGPKEYNASPQNWTVVQDTRGVMYFGNTDGVLEYDGLSWRLIRVAGGAPVQALAIDSTGRIYAGAQGDIGYLQPDGSGTLQYVSLKNKLPLADRNFVDVWRVFVAPDGVYFSTVQWLARLNPDGTVKIFRPSGRFGKAFLASGAVYVKSSIDGLLKLTRDRLEPVAGGTLIAKADPKADALGAVDVATGSIVACQQGLFWLDSLGLRPFATEADKLLSASTVYTISRFPGGEVAIGTKTGGLLLLDENGQLDRIIGRAEGLEDVYVTSIARDRQGNVWLAHFNGITRFNLGYSRFTSAQGLHGNTLALTRVGGALYVGTSAGLFRVAPGRGYAPRFVPVEGINEAVYAVLPYGGNGLLAGTSRGMYQINGIYASKAFDTATAIYDLNASHRQPDQIYAAGNEGVVLLQLGAGGWREIAAAAEAGQTFRTVAEDSDGRVWASSRDRIWRLNFTKQPVARQSFSVSGTESVEWLNAYRFRKRVVFATQKGLMSFSESAGKLMPDPVVGNAFADGSRDVYSVSEDSAGNAWVTGKGYHEIVRPNGTVSKMPLLEAGIDWLYGLFLDRDGTAWAFGSDYALYRWSPPLSGDPNRDFHVVMRSIAVTGSKDPLYGGAGPMPGIALKYRDNALRIEFAAPFYENSATVEYQYQLEGNDRGWSPWSHEFRAAYTNLSEGSYTFRVRARNPHGIVTKEAVSRFSIAAPWYRTWWAFTLYAICGAVFVWGIVRWRVRQLEEDKRQLENTVAERTVEIRQQRDEIQVQERKAHSLLLNILPAQVADELKASGAVKPVGFDDVTVCFTDFVGFTLSSEKMPPSTLVETLNEYFTAFDEIIARYGLEKLKTIGDSYMFVSGLPERRPSHAVDAVMAAMEMVQVVRRLAGKAGTGWNIRIGLHSGPVVAGVVGTRKFAFDIWGNTVNFAARMESSGVPGSVNLSERTHRLTSGLLVCEARGHIKIKEGRELPMFLVRGLGAGLTERYREAFGYAPRSIPGESVAEMEPAIGTAAR